MTKESIEPSKLAIIAAVSALVIFSSFQEDAVLVKIDLYGEIGLIYNGLFQVFVLILLGFAGFGWMYYALKLYYFAPERMKRTAAHNVLASFLIAIISPGTTMIGINSYLPGINKLIFAFGIVIVVNAFMKEPRLMYVLPFKVSRLYVIDKGGIPLFSHSWTVEKDSVQKALFSGMIIGIQSILHETLNKGDVKEIIVDESTLLIKSVDSFQFACVLVASKTSRTLRLALEDFAEQFRIKYGDKLEGRNSPNTFKDASILIKECFPFVPE